MVAWSVATVPVGAPVRTGAPGGVVSTVHVRVVSGPGKPAELRARTENVWVPSLRP
jgi:hypothetical protein